MKQRLIVKTALSAAILATLAGCATQPTQEWAADTTYKLTVLHTKRPPRPFLAKQIR